MNDVFDRVADKTTLLDAWRLVKAKGKGGGIDSVSIEQFDLKFDQYIDILYRQLRENVYLPEPYKTFNVPKKGNEFRKLCLPAIKDKIVQTAAKIVIEPMFDRGFLNVSYGYRIGRGPIKAINRIKNRIEAERRSWVTMADIDNYFDSIKPEILYSGIDQQINSPRLMKLIKLWVEIGSLNYRHKYEPYTEGIPQGCILSPLFSNIYLHPFDRFMIEKGYGLVRYADDFVVLSHSQNEGYAAFRDAKSFLENQLHLKLNDNWMVKKASGSFEFLHITFCNAKTVINEECYYRLLQKLEDSILINDGKPESVKLQQSINGINAYYGKLIPQTTLEKLDNALCDIIVRKMVQALTKKLLINHRLIDEYLRQIAFFSISFQASKSTKISEIKKQITSLSVASSKKTKDPYLVKAVRTKMLQYENLANNNRELVVATPGVFLGKNHKGISVKEMGVIRQNIPANNLTNITIISENVSLSGKVIHWCAQNSIPIDFIGFDGLPFAKIYTPQYADADLQLAQVKAIENGQGAELLKKFAVGKIKNQIGLIKYYYKYRKDRNSEYADVYLQRVTQMKEILIKIYEADQTCIEKLRQIIMGYEGYASSCYWDMVVRLLNNYTTFDHREKQGATDLVNCLLNYGYGILYCRIWKAIILNRLNPCVSYLHIPKCGKPTLAFDLIEEFRQQVVDKVVFALITKGENVIVVKGILTPDSRKRLTQKVIERFNSIEQFRGKSLKLLDIIENQVKNMVQHLLGETKYKPYVAKW